MYNMLSRPGLHIHVKYGLKVKPMLKRNPEQKHCLNGEV